jgi:O-antigen/teichoic acid export membrane protein
MKYLLKNITDFLSNQQFLSNFSISSFATLATIISPILIMPFIILYAGAEVFAKYLLFNTTLLIIFTLSDLGVGYDFKRNIILQKSANARAKLFSNQFFFHFLSICSIIFF